jgi:hypothetical protein
MALGGGTFTGQNKVLPGTYMNFISLPAASSALSERGIAAMALELDWGADGRVFEVSSTDFYKHSERIFGYDYLHEKMKGLRDLFKNIHTLYAYRLNSSGVKAGNAYATAVNSGIRGNDLKVIIQTNVDDNEKFDVQLLLNDIRIDFQTVSSAAELSDNDFVTWKKEADLAVTASTPLTGGTNGAAITADDHQSFLEKIESYTFNALGVVTETLAINEFYASFCRRMRDEHGVKFQAVVYNYAADYEGVVNLKNTVSDDGWSIAALVYWVTGIIAGCEINATNLNKVYNGEFSVNVDFTQAALEQAIEAGEFMLHQVGTEKRVLADINSLVSTSEEKGEIFRNNKTIRLADQLGVDLAILYNTKYLGKVSNDQSGQISLWADIVKYLQELREKGAIGEFEDADITVAPGEQRRAVAVTMAIRMVDDMGILYLTCMIA